MKKILLVAAGMTPQIITETVYALSMLAETSDDQWVPDEIHILTTTPGIEKIKKSLLEQRHLQNLCNEYDLPPIRMDESCFHLFQHTYKDEDGVTQVRDLDDIKTSEDSEIVADAMCQLIQQFTSDDEIELHVSIAGGRKAMGYYAGYAMSLYGRGRDRMSHTLVSAEFENTTDFYYPTKNAFEVTNRNGDKFNAQDAEVWLIDIPFVRLRKSLETNQILSNNSFSDVIAKININTVDLSLSLKYESSVDDEENNIKGTPRERCIVYVGDTLKVELEPREFALLYWMADYTKNPDLPPLHRPQLKFDGGSDAAKQKFVDDHNDSGMSAHFKKYHTPFARSVDSNRIILVDQSYFDSTKSTLMKKLKKELGVDLLNHLIPQNSKRKQVHFLKVGVNPKNINLCSLDY